MDVAGFLCRILIPNRVLFREKLQFSLSDFMLVAKISLEMELFRLYCIIVKYNIPFPPLKSNLGESLLCQHSTVGFVLSFSLLPPPKRKINYFFCFGALFLGRYGRILCIAFGQTHFKERMIQLLTVRTS